MNRDAWDSDRFEYAVTRTLIALYETALSPDDVGPHWIAIGNLKDDPALLRRAAEYLETA